MFVNDAERHRWDTFLDRQKEKIWELAKIHSDRKSLTTAIWQEIVKRNSLDDEMPFVVKRQMLYYIDGYLDAKFL